MKKLYNSKLKKKKGKITGKKFEKESNLAV